MTFPGETVEVSGSMDDYMVKGNDFHRSYEEFRKLCKPYDDKLNAVSEFIMNKRSEGTLTSQQLDFLRQLFLPINTERKKVMESYLYQHLDEDIAVYLVAELGKEAGKYLDSISVKAQNGTMSSVYRAIKQVIDRQKLLEESKKNMKEGVLAPDFTLKDLNRHALSLSSLRGKYVVLDFWGSWCGWCIKGIPDMKKYYDKYKGKMEILGIACRDTEQNWKEAVKKHELPWLQVMNTEEEDITLKYGIQGYPTKIVVDPEGRVTKIVVGESPAFYEYLDRLFK
ncbi:thioredoxin family protein [gut metagenome]|uniref:Thioredoxin family protein n=1 Tax=gut metagenome TaxID=749906 RepID=J9H7V4_9ZZZZ